MQILRPFSKPHSRWSKVPAEKIPSSGQHETRKVNPRSRGPERPAKQELSIIRETFVKPTRYCQETVEINRDLRSNSRASVRDRREQ